MNFNITVKYAETDGNDSSYDLDVKFDDESAVVVNDLLLYIHQKIVQLKQEKGARSETKLIEQIRRPSKIRHFRQGDKALCGGISEPYQLRQRLGSVTCEKCLNEAKWLA